MKVDPYSHFFEEVDDISSFLPRVSTVTNLVNLFQKCIILPMMERKIIEPSPNLTHYYTYLKDKSFLRCFILLIPLLGNLIVAVYDVQTKWKDKDFVLDAVQLDGLLLRLASSERRDDREIVLAAVQQNGLALQYASERLKNDPDIVRAAVKQNVWALQYSVLKDHEDFVFDLVGQNFFVLAVASGLQNVKRIVLPSVGQKGFMLQHASLELRNDPDVVLAAVEQDGNALEFASEELRNNRKIVLAAVKQNGWALKYASLELRNDPEIVRAALYQRGFLNIPILRYAGHRIQDNERFMLDLIAEKAMAMGYASTRLRNYVPFLIKGMERNGMALEYIEKFQDNEPIVFAAYEQNKAALQFASPRARKVIEHIIKPDEPRLGG